MEPLLLVANLLHVNVPGGNILIATLHTGVLIKDSGNKLDWENRYLHINYSKSREEGVVVGQPYPDAFIYLGCSIGN